MSTNRILILEDDPAVAEVYAQALRTTGCEVALYNRFEDARSELRRQVPDGLLTDVRLGEYNGLQLALLYRSLAPEGRILVVSGHADPVIQKDAAALNATFLVKPVDLDLLRKTLRGHE